jgi:hypothetical protein
VYDVSTPAQDPDQSQAGYYSTAQAQFGVYAGQEQGYLSQKTGQPPNYGSPAPGVGTMTNQFGQMGISTKSSAVSYNIA